MIRELTTEKDFEEVFPLVQQLRTHLSLEQYKVLIQEMRQKGYRAFVLEEESQFRCFAGVEVRVNLYHLRHLFVFDLVTDNSERSKGNGARMFSFLEKLAVKENCSSIELTSGVQRLDAHRFYEKMGMDRNAFAFLISSKLT